MTPEERAHIMRAFDRLTHALGTLRPDHIAVPDVRDAQRELSDVIAPATVSGRKESVRV